MGMNRREQAMMGMNAEVEQARLQGAQIYGQTVDMLRDFIVHFEAVLTKTKYGVTSREMVQIDQEYRGKIGQLITIATGLALGLVSYESPTPEPEETVGTNNIN